MENEFDFESEADEAPGEAPKVDLAALQARLDKAEADNLALRRQMTAAAFAAPPKNELAPPPPPPLDLKGLPDPMDDRTQWEGAAAQRINQYLNQRLELERQAAQAQPEANPADHLWNEFKAAHPDIAADEEKVGVAVHFAKEKAKRRGLDVDRYMAGASDMFFEDVVAEHERLFGKAKPVQQKAEDVDNRTAGLFGGMEGMGKPTQAKSTEPLGSLSGDILKMQRSAGLTW